MTLQEVASALLPRKAVTEHRTTFVALAGSVAVLIMGCGEKGFRNKSG